MPIKQQTTEVGMWDGGIAPRPYVVAADNQPMEPKVWLITWGGLVLLWVALYACAYGVLREVGVPGAWPWWLGLLVSIVGFVRVSQWVLPALTGDLPAVREIERSAEVQLNRTDKESGVWLRRLDNEREAEGNRHAEEMARIQAQMQGQIAALTDDVREMRRALVQYSVQASALPVSPTLPTAGYAWSPPRMSVDQRAAHDWALSLYGDDGQPNPAQVVPGKGYLVGKVPWNAVEGWPPGATSLLVDGPNGFPPVLVKAGGSHNYKLNLGAYPDAQRVRDALGVLKSEGWVG